MEHCERYESHISAWIDDELARPDQVELIDHLVRCAPCREFTVRARALDGWVATVRPPRAASLPSPDVWSRIQQATVTQTAPSAGGSAGWSAGWRAAAALAFAVGLGALFMHGSARDSGAPTGRPAGHDVEVRLGENAGRMSDARFMELTTEVLRADPRYHAALYRVMEQVVRDADVHEAAIEYASPDDRADEPLLAEAVNRNPA